MKRSDKTDLNSEFKAMRERNSEKTTKEVLHTHLPWSISKDGCDIEAKYKGGSFGICSMYATEATQANAELICKAVNERQKLLDSNRELKNNLSSLIAQLEEDGPMTLKVAQKIDEIKEHKLNLL